MIDLTTWTDEDLRAGLAAIVETRTPSLVKTVRWDEALHPRDSDGEFAGVGVGLGRDIVDRIVNSMHDGMTQRSRHTHIMIERELRNANLSDHARHYREIVREHARNHMFVHPRTAFGQANQRILTTHPTEAPATAAAPVAAAAQHRNHFFTGDRLQTYRTSESSSAVISARDLAQRVLNNNGGPTDYVRAYRNARNAGMSHQDIIRFAADLANEQSARDVGDPTQPPRPDYTPESVEQALTEQYRMAGRGGFSPGSGSYESGGRSYEWGTRPPTSSSDPMAPTIGRVVGAATRPEPARPAGEPRSEGVHPPTPPISNDERYITRSGPGNTITSADRILAHHPQGGINDEVQKLYERDLLKFQQANGQIILLKNGDPRFDDLIARYRANIGAYEEVANRDPRHRQGLGFMMNNLGTGSPALHPYHGSAANEFRAGSVIALDKDGNPVAAVGFSDDGSSFHVGVAGSAGLLPGAGMAMQWGLANVCVKYGKSLGSSYLPDAKPAHASWGRHISSTGNSHWTKEDVKKIASFRPAAPVVQGLENDPNIIRGDQLGR